MCLVRLALAFVVLAVVVGPTLWVLTHVVVLLGLAALLALAVLGGTRAVGYLTAHHHRRPTPDEDERDRLNMVAYWVERTHVPLGPHDAALARELVAFNAEQLDVGRLQPSTRRWLQRELDRLR